MAVTGKIIPLLNMINAGQGLLCVFASMACINHTDVANASALANTHFHSSLFLAQLPQKLGRSTEPCSPVQVNSFGAGCLESQACLVRGETLPLPLDKTYEEDSF